MAIKAVVIDIDDTLFMTEAVAFELENEAARSLGAAPMSRQVHLATWGKPIAQAAPERFPGIDVAQFLHVQAEVIAEYARSGKLDALSEDNIAALDSLVKSGYQLYSVTSRHRLEVAHFMDGSHELQRFLTADAIFHHERNGYHKPDPRVFDGVLKEAGIGPAEALYVGDSTTDCLAAKSAGLHFVACLESGLRPRLDFESLPTPPDGYVQVFADLPVWLQEYRP